MCVAVFIDFRFYVYNEPFPHFLRSTTRTRHQFILLIVLVYNSVRRIEPQYVWRLSFVDWHIYGLD